MDINHGDNGDEDEVDYGDEMMNMMIVIKLWNTGGIF